MRDIRYKMRFSHSIKKCNLSRRALMGLISLMVFAPLLTSCASRPVVESFRDPDVDYKVYKTFSFLSANAKKGDRKKELGLEEKVLFSIIRANMENRGYIYKEKGEESDFAIGALITNRYQTEYVPERTFYPSSDLYFLQYTGSGNKSHQLIAPVSYPQTYGGYTSEFFLIYSELNFYDSKTDKKIWKGSGLYSAETYDINTTAPTLISSILERFCKMPKDKR